MLPLANRNSSVSNIDFATVKKESQKCLFKLLEKFDGSKTIIWDDNLIGAFEFVANASLLRDHDASRLFRLSDVKLVVFNEIKTDYILFFIRKDYHVARHIAEILHRCDRMSIAKTSLVFVPFRCASIEKVLEQNKVDLGRLHSIEELKIELFVLDTDLISTENEHVFKDMHLNEDYSSAHQVAQGLLKLQDYYGQIPKISGHGKGAKLVADLLVKHRKLNPRKGGASRQPAKIQQLILIDRRVDLITPLLTQLTYEGLLDEVFGVNQGKINLPAERFVEEANQKPQDDKKAPPSKVKGTKRFELRSTEDLYARLRDSHINAVADLLKQSAKKLQADHEDCKSQKKTIAEIGKVVERLKQMEIAKKSQFNHVTIAELVNEQTLKPEFIMGLRIEHELLQEDRLNRVIPEIDTKLLRQEPALHVLRLICLQSMISNGFKSKIGDYYKREIIQNYGPSYIAFILQLEKVNLLMSQERDGLFSQLKSKLNLVRDDIDECNPRDMSYVYGGYSPISILAIKNLASPFHSRSQYDHLRALLEPTISYTEPSATAAAPLINLTNMNNMTSSTPPTNETYASSLTNNAISAASMLLSASGISGVNPRVRRNSTTSSQSSSEETRTVLVFFIGGCTFAEISALRFLSQQDEINCEFLVGTTKIINGKTFLKSLWPLTDHKIS